MTKASNKLASPVRLAGSVIKAPKHKRSHTTPANKRLSFYIGVVAPTVQDYALQVMAGKAPAISLDKYLADYGAPQASVDKVTLWAAKTGHTILGYDRFLRLLHVVHNAAGVRAVYSAKLSEYDDGNGGLFTGRNSGLTIPAEIASFISGVHGIDGRPHARTKIRIGAEIKPTKGGKRGGKAGSTAARPRTWNPVQLAQHFGVHRNNLGAGTACGFFSLGGGMDTAVLAKANARLSLPAADWNFLFSDGATNTPNADGSLNGADGENYLDGQMQQGIAPKAKLFCSFATNTGVGIAHGFAALFQQANLKSASGSWGQAEENWDQQDINLTEETLAAGQAMGINIANAAGDDGSNDNVGDGKAHMDYPASSKFNTSCAGVYDDGKTVTVWGGKPNDGLTGGGVSVVFPKYTDEQLLLQAAGHKLPVNADTGEPGRIGGDIAGIADPQTAIEVMDGTGKVFGIGGTSAVSPFTAGSWAATEGDLGHPLPPFNALIYKAAAAGKSVCNIVTKGSNGAYSAKPGDVINCCGLGTVDYDKVFTVASQPAA
jgi:kumamolisin